MSLSNNNIYYDDDYPYFGGETINCRRMMFCKQGPDAALINGNTYNNFFYKAVRV